VLDHDCHKGPLHFQRLVGIVLNQKITVVCSGNVDVMAIEYSSASANGDVTFERPAPLFFDVAWDGQLCTTLARTNEQTCTGYCYSL
jgi:hypothetical protein